MKRVALMAGLVGLAASPAVAADITKTSDGYTYFYRPGADLAAHDAAVNTCRTVARQLHQPISMGPTSVVAPAGTSPVAAGVGGAIGMAIAMAIQQKMADGRAEPVNVENCMVVLGWQVAAVDEAEGKAFLAQDAKARTAQLGGWVGAATPHGSIVRTFENEGVANTSKGLFALATKTGTSLSLETTAKPKDSKPTGPTAAYLPQPKPAQRPKMQPSGKPPKPLKDAELGGVPPDSALIVINVKGDAEVGVSLERVGPDAATPAWVDGRPGSILAERPTKAYAKAGVAQGATLVYAVPPGRWRLDGMVVNTLALSVCMGGPAFDVAAGDVVYAGSFDPEHLAPEMDLAPAKAVFPGLSGLGDKVRAADWKNGVQGGCSGAYAYVMELPDRPFVDGYALGSRARPAISAPPPAAGGSAAEAK